MWNIWKPWSSPDNLPILGKFRRDLQLLIKEPIKQGNLIKGLEISVEDKWLPKKNICGVVVVPRNYKYVNLLQEIQLVAI